MITVRDVGVQPLNSRYICIFDGLNVITAEGNFDGPTIIQALPTNPLPRQLEIYAPGKLLGDFSGLSLMASLNAFGTATEITTFTWGRPAYGGYIDTALSVQGKRHNWRLGAPINPFRVTIWTDEHYNAVRLRDQSPLGLLDQIDIIPKQGASPLEQPATLDEAASLDLEPAYDSDLMGVMIVSRVDDTITRQYYPFKK